MAKEKLQATMDGNQAAAYVAYAFTDVATIYPITPSSTMAEYVDEWQAAGRKNIFGQTVSITEMQSEGGAAGAFHGVLATGALASTFTASQGLLLMIPNMYRVAGEFLPGVMHVSARALAGNALSIFGDHSDVMACTQTGFAMICSANVQEAMDLAAVAHLAAIKGSMPFMHFFDGFRTSHEQQKIELWDYEQLAGMVDYDALAKFRNRALNPEHPTIKGTAQNPDIVFQSREAGNYKHQALPAIVADYMQQVSEATGRTYHPFDYYGDPEATDVVVAMGSISEVAYQAVDYLRAQGKKVGFLQVHMYRPFAPEYMFAVLPETVKRMAVLDRVKISGGVGNPLYQDMRTAFYDSGREVQIIGGRYGLASKDTVPADIVAVYNNLAAENPKNDFTVAINDDVYHTSLEPEAGMPDMLPEGTIQCKFWGLGSDGTVGANKQAVAIINDETDLNAQAYFAYDSKKSGGVTISHLRFGQEKIKAPYLIRQADFVSCSNAAYIHTYDLLEGLRPGGTFLLNCKWTDDELNEQLPAAMKRYLAANNIKFYTLNALGLAQEIGLGKRTNMIMQSAFFKLANIIPLETAVQALNASIEHAYGRKGQDVVDKNKLAVTAGLDGLHQVEIPAAWLTAEDAACAACEVDERPEYAKKLLDPINAQQGDKLPVSAFLDAADGTFQPGSAKYEKRGVAPFVPVWKPENCIQCNRCSMVCPHAAIRPILLNEDEKAAAPADFVTKKAIGKGLENMEVRLQVSPLDCQGCGLCVEVCPARQKALEMVDLDANSPDVANWDYAMTVSSKDDMIKPDNVKNAQFRQPYLEFSGACAGCGETPYAKLVTQLFGERMIVANATGCSSIWGASVPSMPYTTNQKGQGPAWGNSLFEDNAEYGLGIALAVKQQREHLIKNIEAVVAGNKDAELTAALQNWLAVKDEPEACKAATEALLPLLENSDDEAVQAIYQQRDQLGKKSIWIFGGDGWAYDIGYGGLDHVLASGENVNVLVFDTEVYSNTGGQSSKSTPTAAIAKFSVAGKKTKKKDLGMMAMSYGYVYVAQIAMGADMNQTLKALREAEAYDGPSLVIAYSTCINHGIKAGMNKGMEEQAKAVQSGYWHLYRYNPALVGSGQKPFVLDSKEPTGNLRDFLLGEVRYDSLFKIAPDKAEELFAKTTADAKERYEGYRRLAEQER
ncbi:MAG: pyruvate:ferredoxin (flavodoxin) oxidoreductase [Firmicutes bacterium]|nr:pyruvate:ferredoxin (flavodoxin) oxidoreductase [Bacillota bacterium]